jgi:hypothetical protein
MRVDPLVTLLTTTGAGATYVLARRWRRRGRRRALARRLGSYDVELPLDTRHLSAGLAALAIGARTLRLVLETPLSRAFEASREASPLRLGESLAEYDLALADARHELWRWLLGVRNLTASDYGLLRRLHLDPRPLRALIYKPGVFDRGDDLFAEPLFPSLPDLDLVIDELCAAIEQLRRFEIALLSHRADPYR